MSGVGAPDAGRPSLAVTIRPVATVSEYHDCEEIQRRAWNFDTDLDVIPLTQLVAAHKAGGLVLGAFDESGRMRGFSYGFPGRTPEGGLLHYSHMTAVEPGLRATGLGARLKWAQRQAAMEQGVALMVWTYDPLESLNGYFNFSKLGVVAGTYWENLYGDTSSELHRGTPTDRLKASWFLASERVERRARGVPGELARGVSTGAVDLPVVLAAEPAAGVTGPGVPDLGCDAALLACEIPESIQQVKAADRALALNWRMATRAVFTHYLGNGWFVRECVRTATVPARTLYVLERGVARGLGD